MAPVGFTNLNNDVLMCTIDCVAAFPDRRLTLFSLSAACKKLRILCSPVLFKELPADPERSIGDAFVQLVAESPAMRACTRRLHVHLSNDSEKALIEDVSVLPAFLRSFERLTAPSITISAERELDFVLAVHNERVSPLFPHITELTTCENVTWLQGHCPQLEKYTLTMSPGMEKKYCPFYWLREGHVSGGDRDALEEERKRRVPTLLEEMASSVRFKALCIRDHELDNAALKKIPNNLPWLSTLDLTNASMEWTFSEFLDMLNGFEHLQRVCYPFNLLRPVSAAESHSEHSMDHRWALDIRSYEVLGRAVFEACPSLTAISFGAKCLLEMGVRRRSGSSTPVSVEWLEVHPRSFVGREEYAHLDAEHWVLTDVGRAFFDRLWAQE